MDSDEQNPVQTAAKPKKRWYQYRLKTLMLLPVVVGIGTYWYDWASHRPPYRDYERVFYDQAYWEFEQDLFGGRLDHAYESTSARFKRNMSRRRFDDLMRTHANLRQYHTRQAFYWPVRDSVRLRNSMTAVRTIRGQDDKTIELWVWVVMYDSFFYRRPPPPQVEEVQIREISDAEWKSGTASPLKPSWERE